MRIDEDIINRVIETKDPVLMRQLRILLTDPYYSFRPRWDNPEERDEQSSFVQDQFEGVKVALGGTGSGKTESACFSVAKFLRTTPPPVDRCPYLFVSESKAMVGEIWVEKLSKYIPEGMIENMSWYSKTRGYPSSIVLKPHKNGNRWVIDVKSYAQGEREFRSLAAGGFYIDEPCPHNIVVELLARCRDWRLPGSKIYTLTPLDPLPELEDLYNNRESEHVSKNWKFYHLNTHCNDMLADKQFLDDTPDEWIDTRTFGAFASFMGAVFKEFNSSIHVVEPFEIPSGWTHYRGMDVGYHHPTVCLWAAIDPDGRYYIYNEYHATEKLLAEHAEAIKSYAWDDNHPDYKLTFCDWQAQERREYAKLGLATAPARKDVLLSIEEIKKKLMVKGDGKPQLFIFKHCQHLIREMRTYRWHIASGRGLNPQAPKDMPVKNEDDCVDALRYLVFSAESKRRGSKAPPLPVDKMRAMNRFRPR